jgi:succinoglycan biosynthesis protein ExoM
MSEHMIVTVCTRERPKMLMACLRSVLTQLEAAEVQTSLVVVENDSEPKNQDAVLRLGEQFPMVRIEYRLEPELGIPFARNTAVETALELGADWIFFIDDDEEACEGWFDAYLAAMRKWDADVFRGPVNYIYPEQQADWLRMKEFDAGPTGSFVKTAITNNLAMRAIIFAASGLGLRFDARFRLTGGSDVALSRAATARGVSVRWVREARVLERQSGRRLTAKWLRERAERSAATDLRIMMADEGKSPALLFVMKRCSLLLLKALLKIAALPALLVIPSRAASNVHSAQLKLQRARGYLRGLIASLPIPYAQIHGE